MGIKSIDRFIKSRKTACAVSVAVFGVALLLIFACRYTRNNVIAISTGQNIADRAKELAWGESDKSKSSSPTTAFSAAAKSVGLDDTDDCLRFIQTVILSSDIDLDFPKGGYSHNGGIDEYYTVNYMNNSDKWEKIGTTNTASLQPGDILVSAVNGIGNNHIFIYLGNGKVAAANQGKWYGRIENLSEEWDPNGDSDKPFYYGDNKYQIFRFKSDADNNAASTNAAATSGSSSKISESQLEEFAQNNILFYDPGDCISGGNGSVCGSTAREKYWSALGKYTDDPIKKAGILGSLQVEGQYSPTSWQCGNGMDSGGNFVVPWDTLFESSYSNPTYIGVGAFAITSGLTTYLHWINDNTPNSIQYLKDPVKYAYNWCRCDGEYCGDVGSKLKPGDQTMEAIGEAAFDEFIEHEVEYAMTKFNNTVTNEYLDKNFATPSDAASWWARYWEVGEDYLNPSPKRLQEAEKVYDELKDFKCNASPSSNPGSSTSAIPEDITLIGDSIAVMAEEELQKKFPNSYLTMVGSRHSTSGGACAGDKGGLDILQKLSDGSGTILTQHHNKNSCDEVTIDKNSLKDNVVWELGTNSVGASKETIEKVIKLVGDDRKLFLVTPYNGDSRAKDDTEAIAQMYRDVAEEYDNVYVVDWANAVKDSGYTYVYAEPSMTVHPTDEGKELLANLISEAVSGSDGCTTYEGEYPQYNQCGDPRWSNYPYSTDNICGSGCGAASMAMLATVATGQDIFPNDIADLLGNQYYDSTSIATLDPIVGKHYGFDVEVVNTSGVEDTKTKMRDYLKKGYMIHFTGRGCYPGFIYASGGCTKGHVIGLFDIDDNDIVTQANSGMGEVHQKASLDDMANALNFGVFTAIKGGNGSKNNCNNLCNNKNSSVGADGLTEEQAQKVAHYYNTQHKPRGCCGLTNCVEFSNFFVSELTTKGTPGGYSVSGDGREVAPNLIANGQAEGGTEPRVWAVFSKTSGNHTGVVVGANDDGTYITVEAAWPGWTDGYMDGNGNGRVYTDKTFTDGTYEFAYFENSLNSSKLQEILDE